MCAPKYTVNNPQSNTLCQVLFIDQIVNYFRDDMVNAKKNVSRIRYGHWNP